MTHCFWLEKNLQNLTTNMNLPPIFLLQINSSHFSKIVLHNSRNKTRALV